MLALLRLIDGNNITTEDHHMWLIPFSYGEPHTLNVTFRKTQIIAGLRIWNYNKSPEDSYRGVRQYLAEHRTPVEEIAVYILPRSTTFFICVSGEGYSCFHRWRCHLPTRGVPDQERTRQLSLWLCSGDPLHWLHADAWQQEHRGLSQVGEQEWFSTQSWTVGLFLTVWYEFQRKLYEARAAEHGLWSTHHALWLYPLIYVLKVNGHRGSVIYYHPVTHAGPSLTFTHQSSFSCSC